MEVNHFKSIFIFIFFFVSLFNLVNATNEVSVLSEGRTTYRAVGIEVMGNGNIKYSQSAMTSFPPNITNISKYVSYTFFPPCSTVIDETIKCYDNTPKSYPAKQVREESNITNGNLTNVSAKISIECDVTSNPPIAGKERLYTVAFEARNFYFTVYNDWLYPFNEFYVIGFGNESSPANKTDLVFIIPDEYKLIDASYRTITPYMEMEKTQTNFMDECKSNGQKYIIIGNETGTANPTSFLDSNGSKEYRWEFSGNPKAPILISFGFTSLDEFLILTYPLIPLIFGTVILYLSLKWKDARLLLASLLPVLSIYQLLSYHPLMPNFFNVYTGLSVLCILLYFYLAFRVYEKINLPALPPREPSDRSVI